MVVTPQTSDSGIAATAPPEAFFVASAVFHYLGPSFAVVLFEYVDVLGVAWIRIVSAAVLFAIWRRPWRRIRGIGRSSLGLVAGWGTVLGLMNCVFYLAIARLPLGTVAAIEFLPVVLLAALGSRTRRNKIALATAVTGVYLLTDVALELEPAGVLLAFVNAGLFALYITLGHRAAQTGASNGIDALALAMLVAAIVVMPVAATGALTGLVSPIALAAGLGVGVSSSVIPYILDQLAMARLSRSAYALLVSILPATATVIGAIVLRQIPGAVEVVGIGLVVVAVRIHRSPVLDRDDESI